MPIRSLRVRNPAAPPISAATSDLMPRGRAVLRAGGRDSIEYRELNRAVRSAIRRDTRTSIEDNIRERGLHCVWQSSVVGAYRPPLSVTNTTKPF